MAQRGHFLATLVAHHDRATQHGGAMTDTTDSHQQRTDDSASELVDLLSRTFAQSLRLIGEVRPGQETDSTPCAQFDVRALVGHMTFAAQRIAQAGRREPLATSPSETAEDASAQAFGRAADEAVAAWSTPGALEGDIELPFGTFPATVVAQIYVLEQATHAWDLAVALRRRDELEEGLAAAVLPLARGVILPEYRGPEPMPFGPEITVDPGLPPYDRLAAFMGRTPG
jgi:uncharacterized protein (TIGR03086 family)